jgi:hypothetical protein
VCHERPDETIVLRAVDDARSILAEYVAPGPHDAAHTIVRLLAVLDRTEVVNALDRLTQRNADPSLITERLPW